MYFLQQLQRNFLPIVSFQVPMKAPEGNEAVENTAETSDAQPKSSERTYEEVMRISKYFTEVVGAETDRNLTGNQTPGATNESLTTSGEEPAGATESTEVQPKTLSVEDSKKIDNYIRSLDPSILRTPQGAEVPLMNPADTGDSSSFDPETASAELREIFEKQEFQDALGKSLPGKLFLKFTSFFKQPENAEGQGISGGLNNPMNFINEEAIGEVTPEKQDQVKEGAKEILKGKSRYMAIAKEMNMPWQLVGALFYREASCDFSKYMCNGDPLGKPVVNEPKDAKLCHTWEESARDILGKSRYNFKSLGDSPSLVEVANAAEGYNGTGYKKRGLVSPYVWAGHPKYENQGGMYVADGEFDKSVKDPRVGIMPLYMALMEA